MEQRVYKDYFQFIIKKHEIITNNPSLKLCENKVDKRIPLKIKTGYYLDFLRLKQ